MRAAVTVAHGDVSNISIRSDYPDPDPANDEVIVKVAATAVNYHDVLTRRGMPGIKSPLPVVVGSDVAGVVEKLGSHVSGWEVGKRVLIDPIFRDGVRVGLLGETADGGRAEFVAVPAAQLLPVPEEVSLDKAAALPLAYGTAHRMLCAQGRLAKGERILILGASGGVGVACVQLATLLGAEVIACASSDDKLTRLRRLGAVHGINYSQQSIAESVNRIAGKPRLNGAGGVDVAVNFTGGDTWIDTQRCVRLGGRILTCGATAGFRVEMDMRFLWTFEHQMIGSNGWSRDDLVKLLEMLAVRRLDPEIDAILPLQDSARAELLLEQRQVFGKLLLKP